MKKIVLFLFISLVFYFSCKKINEGKIAILSEKIQYDVDIINNEPDAEWWMQNIEGSKREKFINIIINGAKNQSIQIFDDKFLPTSFKKVISDFISYDTLNFDNKKKHIVIDSIIISNIFDISKINSIGFVEKWSFNDKSLDFFKEVNSYCPIMSFLNEKNKIQQIHLFWIVPDTTKSKSENIYKITEKIQYDVNISSGNNIEWWKNNIEKSSKEKFFNLLIEKIEKQQVIAYDYFNKKIDKKKFNNIFHRTDTILIEDISNPGSYYDTIIKRDFDVNSIAKLRFIEEWTIDMKTFLITKRVKSYSPLCEFIDDNGNIRGYTPLFWIHFDDNK